MSLILRRQTVGHLCPFDIALVQTGSVLSIYHLLALSITAQSDTGIYDLIITSNYLNISFRLSSKDLFLELIKGKTTHLFEEV